jgi:hypothetical protein
MIGAVRPVGYQAADFGWFGIELLDQTADAFGCRLPSRLGSRRIRPHATPTSQKAVSNPY